MYNNKILNFQEFTAILKACTRNVLKPIECTTYIAEISSKRYTTGWPPRKILGTIFEVDERETLTNKLDNKKTNDNA